MSNARSDSCSSTLPEAARAWVSVGGEPSRELADLLEARVASLRQQGLFTEQDEVNLSELTLSTSKDAFVTSPDRLEKLRRLCQIYDVRIRPEAITSHRKCIGPVIVAVKKLLFRLVEGLLGKTIKHQRDFNAEVVSLLTDLCNEARRGR